MRNAFDESCVVTVTASATQTQAGLIDGLRLGGARGLPEPKRSGKFIERHKRPSSSDLQCNKGCRIAVPTLVDYRELQKGTAGSSWSEFVRESKSHCLCFQGIILLGCRR